MRVASKEFTKQKQVLGLSGKTRGVVKKTTKTEGTPLTVSRLQRAIGNYSLHASIRHQAPIIQRTCACGGRCASCAVKKDEYPTIQPKLTVGPANDVYEQEADRVADQVMRMPTLHNKPEQDHRSSTIRIQRHVETSGQHDSSFSDVTLPYTGGTPLSTSMRKYMEPRFGKDFSHVRIHSDRSAQDTASQIQARAFTHGSDIWLGKGTAESDKRLMAHELTHVVQQQTPHPASDTFLETNQSFQASTKAGLGTTSDSTIQRLPFGITLPTGLRFLDSTEQTMATGVYGGSVNFNKVLLSNAVGGGGRPFTTYVPSPIPGISGGTVINIGPSAYNTPGSNRNLLIHELAHSWQSQHHPNPAQFMVNSIESQAAAALAGASAYCYVPGKYFGFYGAEQIAEQVEKGESAIISEVASASPGSTHAGNMLSLTVPRWERRGDPGVKC